MSRPRLSPAQQAARRRELDDIRLARPLTAEERAEDEDLADRLYRRVWILSVRDQERRLSGRVAA